MATPLDVTEAFLQNIDRVAVQSFGALELMGGNLLIHIDDVGTRTIVASGPRKGLYREPTEEDEIHCAVCMPEWVLLHLVEPDPDRPLDLDALADEGVIALDGDLSIYERFMNLGEQRKSSLTIRMQ